jgi:hypothetical protein
MPYMKLRRSIQYIVHAVYDFLCSHLLVEYSAGENAFVHDIAEPPQLISEAEFLVSSHLLIFQALVGHELRSLLVTEAVQTAPQQSALLLNKPAIQKVVTYNNEGIENKNSTHDHNT